MDLQRIEFDAHCGENIEEYAKRAVKHLAEIQKKHEDLELYLICTFNDVKVITTKSSTVDSIVNDFHARMDNNGYEYRQTDEYKASVTAREKELKELNTKAKYNSAINKYIIPLLGDYKLSELNNRIIQSFYNKLQF